MASGESTRERNLSSKPDDSDNQESFFQIDFRFSDNPAVNGAAEPPVFHPSDNVTDDRLQKYPEIDFRELSNSISWDDEPPLTHGIHKHPAVFIPQIPRYLIDTFSGNHNAEGNRPTVLDPFCGSGTTAIEAKIAGRDFLGVEINPLSKLVSEVATTPIPYTVVRNAREEVLEKLESTPVRVYEDHNPEFLDRTKKEHWFQPSAIKRLSTIRKAVADMLNGDESILLGLEPRERKVIRDLGLSDDDIKNSVSKWLILMIANTVFEVSNADPGVSKAHKSKKMHQLIEDGEHPPDALDVYREQLKKSTTCLIDLWNEVYRTNVPGGTEETVTLSSGENSTLHNFSEDWIAPEENQAHRATVDIQLGDARSFDFPSHHENVDLAITSPPYINAINYYRGTKLRLFWIQDLLEETTDVNVDRLKKSIIGSNNVTIKDLDEELPFLIRDEWSGSSGEYADSSLSDLDTDILEIHNGDLTEATHRAYLTWRFFAVDMLKCLTRVYRHLKPGAYFFFIIGENTIGGRKIRSHQFVADIAKNLGKFSSQPNDISPKDGYRLAGMAWDRISRRDLFQSRDHGNGVIENEWVVILQKPA